MEVFISVFAGGLMGQWPCYILLFLAWPPHLGYKWGIGNGFWTACFYPWMIQSHFRLQELCQQNSFEFASPPTWIASHGTLMDREITNIVSCGWSSIKEDAESGLNVLFHYWLQKEIRDWKDQFNVSTSFILRIDLEWQFAQEGFWHSNIHIHKIS